MPLDYPIHERRLDNGLRLVVSPDPSVPNVTVNLWVGVGSRHEEPGRTGFAHLFEHLMFQGSRNVASGEHFSALMAQGARLNATTWFDRTNYFETLPRGAMDLALWLEADRHGHLLDAVTQENLDNQRDVVKEEKRQRYDNPPYGTALIEVYAALFPEEHPYHHATIGSMEDLDAASLEDVHAFFQRYYGPDNTVLTLCGDVEVDEAVAAVERYFGDLAPIDRMPRPPGPQLPPLSEPVRVERLETVPNDRLHLAFRLPVDPTQEYLASSFAVDIVAGLSTSRVGTRLVRTEQSAHRVDAHAMGLVDGSSIALISVDVAPGENPAGVEERVGEELDRFADEGPTPEEMEAVLAQAERAWLSSLASQEERADTISHTTLLHGDPGAVNTHLDRLARVSADDVTEAARTWLRSTNRATVAFLQAEAAAA
ncbi:Zinc protease [Nostocoides japonicum T1-X7]|uniref:Zinc protease n=1 Tax=Nostocoides japonicum T1-X7 TaxID=1194083 RepID=A0A077LZ98_9MICO|nr:pitrilysin family protein [Tetrasphaera japonica]CCH77294.1 Zinc protease [Tetrasphaera japonica T1-X7]